MNSHTTDSFPTILVVDDSPGVRALIANLLRTIDYEVLTACGWVEALWLAHRTPKIDLLLTDIEMPGMRGDALAANISQLHPETALLFVSSSEPPRLAQPFGFLAKPFHVTALFDAVQQALDSRQPVVATAA